MASDVASGPEDDYLAELRAGLLRELTANPHASVAEFQGQVARPLAERYNRTPQDALGGLSPTQVRQLMDADWQSPHGALFVRPDLAREEVEQARIVRNARRLLEALGNAGTRATAAGNLNRAFVQHMIRTLELPADYPLVLEGRRTNEEDLWPLHRLRVLLEIAGLLKRRSGKFSVVKRRAHLLEPARAGELFAHLIRVQFREMNLAYMTRGPGDDRLQESVAYCLYRFHVIGDDWQPSEALVEPLLLPFVLDSMPTSPYYDVAAAVLESRLLRVLERFGLAEARAVPGTSPHREERLYRKAPLFDRLLVFRLGEE